MVETRWHFHEQLDELESIILRMGVASHDLFRRALDVVASDSEADADAVIAGDDQIDAFYMEIERGIVVVFATQEGIALLNKYCSVESVFTEPIQDAEGLLYPTTRMTILR